MEATRRVTVMEAAMEEDTVDMEDTVKHQDSSRTTPNWELQQDSRLNSSRNSSNSISLLSLRIKEWRSRLSSNALI